MRCPVSNQANCSSSPFDERTCSVGETNCTNDLIVGDPAFVLNLPAPTTCVRGDKCAANFDATLISDANRALVLRDYCVCAQAYAACAPAKETAALCATGGDFFVFGCNSLCNVPSSSLASNLQSPSTIILGALILVASSLLTL